MARRNRDTKAILRTIERSEQRSSLFWWMVENHDGILRASERQRINWSAFCAQATKRGLRDTRGQVPSERNARETWRQARRAVAEARAAEAVKPSPRPGSIYPSRISKDWRPPIVPPAPVFQPPAQVPARVRAEPEAATDLPPEAQAEIDKALALLREDDRRKFRFGG
jgi:hypothetical protein